MNIFFLHEDPIVAARMNCDKHTLKIPVEIVTMFQDGFPKEALSNLDCPRTKTGSIRRHTHLNHPMTKWVLQSKSNWNWAREHAIELINEKRRRYPETAKDPNKNLQICLDFIAWCDKNINLVHFGAESLTEKPKCISKGSNARKLLDKLPNIDTIDAYRLFYRLDKPFAKWRAGNKPAWF